MIITGEDYTKWLWGNQHTDGSVYNFTTIPGEGYGDNGQGTEIDLLLASKPSKYIEVTRPHPVALQPEPVDELRRLRRPQPGLENPPGGPASAATAASSIRARTSTSRCAASTARFTPGFKWVDSATIGSNDLGMFDPFTIGKIRYIDRDNAKAVLFQGSLVQPQARLRPDPRLAAAPLGRPELQHRRLRRPGRRLRPAAQAHRQRRCSTSCGVFERVRDIEVDANGPQPRQRPRPRAPASERRLRRASSASIRASKSTSAAPTTTRRPSPNPVRHAHRLRHLAASRRCWPARSATRPTRPTSTSTIRSASACRSTSSTSTSAPSTVDPGGPPRVRRAAHRGPRRRLASSPARTTRPSACSPATPPASATAAGRATPQQVATINVDNEFTDFEEPMAETVIGWKGITVVPTWTIGDLDLSGEYTHIDYNTNWQAWGDTSRGDRPTRSIRTSSRTPASAPTATPTRRSRTRRPTSRSCAASTCSTSARASTSSARSSASTRPDNRLNDAALPALPGPATARAAAWPAPTTPTPTTTRRQLHGRPLRQPAGHHRQRRHRLPVEAVRQPVATTTAT